LIEVKCFSALGAAFVGTFAIAYHKSIHESLIKFFNVKDYRISGKFGGKLYK